MTDSNDVMLTAKRVKIRYGDISDMTLHRWLTDDKLNFPKPIYIKTARYWRLSELLDFEHSRAPAA